MTSGSLIDLDPPPGPDRRWPFYVAWTIGGAVVAAVLFSHLPGPIARPTVTKPPAAAPAAQPVTPPFRVAPVPLAPARP